MPLTLYKTFAWQTFASLRLFTCLVYVSTYCVPIAHLRQNKPFPLLYLGHAQIKKFCRSSTLRSHLLMVNSPKKGFFLFQWVACEQQTQPRTQACSRYPSDQRRFGTKRVLGEFSLIFSLQVWQVMSHPKSPRTTGNEAAADAFPVVASLLRRPAMRLLFAGYSMSGSIE